MFLRYFLAVMRALLLHQCSSYPVEHPLHSVDAKPAARTRTGPASPQFNAGHVPSVPQWQEHRLGILHTYHHPPFL